MQQDSQQPQNSAPIFLLLFVGFIIGLCVGFMTKDLVVRAMIKVMPKSTVQTDLPIKTTEMPSMPAQDGPGVVPADGQEIVPTPAVEGTTEEKKPEEETTPEEAVPTESEPPAAPPVTPAVE